MHVEREEASAVTLVEPNAMAEALGQYERDGYAVFRDVIDADLISEVSAHVEWLVARNPDRRPEQLHHDLMRTDPFWVRLVADDRLLDIAERFVGPNLALFASHYISKPPRDGQPVLWHQDGSYWPLEPMEVVTLWLAVDQSTPENGCMRVIPGTHRHDLAELQTRDDVPNVLGSGLAEGHLDTTGAVDVVLAPGDVSVHHPNIVHGSRANRSSQRRCGLTIRYIPTTTRILDLERAAPFLVRGTPIEGVNQYLPWPNFDPDIHMPFRGSAAWNSSVRALPDRS